MITSSEHKYITGIVDPFFQFSEGLLKNNRPYLMHPWDEVLGDAIGIEEYEGHCLALIGKIPVLLPLEMFTRLEDAKGKRVGILRTDNDYRLRIIEGGH